MKTVAADRKILFAVAVSVLLVLLPLLALPFGLTRPISALVLAAAAIIAVSTVKKRSSFSINKRKVLVLSALCAVVYLVKHVLPVASSEEHTGEHHDDKDRQKPAYHYCGQKTHFKGNNRLFHIFPSLH